jgi:Spy/CpxP family protein refolding chaperone
MKPTKLLLLTTLALGGLLTLSTTTFAQDNTNAPPPAGGRPPGGPPGPGMRGRGPNFDTIAQRLNLTEDQKPKVKAIFDEQRQKMRDLRDNQDLSREDRMAQMQSIRKDTDEKLKGVLTADQFKQWQEMESRMRGPRNGPPPGESSTNAPATTAPQN